MSQSLIDDHTCILCQKVYSIPVFMDKPKFKTYNPHESCALSNRACLKCYRAYFRFNDHSDKRSKRCIWCERKLPYEEYSKYSKDYRLMKFMTTNSATLGPFGCRGSYEGRGCTFTTFDQGEMEAHILRNCPYSHYICTNNKKGCTFFGYKFMQADHNLVCQFKGNIEFECPTCSLKVGFATKRFVDEHLATCAPKDESIPNPIETQQELSDPLDPLDPLGPLSEAIVTLIMGGEDGTNP